MVTHVLDSSAFLALVLAEPGAEVVEPLLGASVMSAVNFSEVASKLIERGYDPDETETGLRLSDLAVEAATEQDAMAAARLLPLGRSFGLSLGDRFCLALAGRLRCVALTADQAWAGLDLGVEVELIR